MAEPSPDSGYVLPPLGAAPEAFTPLPYHPDAVLGNRFLGGLVEAGKSIGQELADVVKLPGDVWKGKYSLEEITRRGPGEALGMVGLGLGVPKPPGSLGIFGGGRTMVPGKAWFDHGPGTMNEAQELEEKLQAFTSNSSEMERYNVAKQIFDQTGWYRGRDTKWRFVIPDEDAALNPIGVRLRDDFRVDLTEKASKLSDVLEHDKLFEAYPFLKDINVRKLDPRVQYSGVYDNTTRTIGTTAQEPTEFMTTLLHEIQHVVQEHESFARGGSVGEFRGEGLPHSRAVSAYSRLAGEVEARLAERMYLEGIGPEDLGNKYGYFPPGLEDTPRHEQIVRFYHPKAGALSIQPVDHDPFAGGSR